MSNEYRTQKINCLKLNAKNVKLIRYVIYALQKKNYDFNFYTPTST